MPRNLDNSKILPLACAQVEAFLRRGNYKYKVSDDGSINARFEDMGISISCVGDSDEILYGKATWLKSVAIDDWDELTELINDWNSTRYWPKAYCVESSGELLLIGEANFDLEQGATEEQLDTYVDCIISTALTLQSFAEKGIKTLREAD